MAEERGVLMRKERTEDRESLIQQLKKSAISKCRHFNGTSHKECNAGVVYDEVKESPSPGKPMRLPCFIEDMFAGPDLPCASRSIPTEEEALAIATERCDRAYRNAAAVGKAKDDAHAKGFKRGSGGRGEVPCTACNLGTIRYSVASVNGHMHAHCTTKGCVSWME
jgi:hypothetical protein